MAAVVEAQQYLEALVKGIVDVPDAVRSDGIEDAEGVLITLYVDAQDMGTIIGKEGRTAKALRILLRAFGAKHGDRTNLRIEEPAGGLRYQAPSHVSDALKDLPDTLV